MSSIFLIILDRILVEIFYDNQSGKAGLLTVEKYRIIYIIINSDTHIKYRKIYRRYTVIFSLS